MFSKIKWLIPNKRVLLCLTAVGVFALIGLLPTKAVSQQCVPSCTYYGAQNGNNPVYVSCPSGTVMTGGGGYCEGRDARLHINRPYGTNMWQVRCKGTNNPAAYIVCCTAS